jgi:hypothetical protein
MDITVPSMAVPAASSCATSLTVTQHPDWHKGDVGLYVGTLVPNAIALRLHLAVAILELARDALLEDQAKRNVPAFRYVHGTMQHIGDRPQLPLEGDWHRVVLVRRGHLGRPPSCLLLLP